MIAVFGADDDHVGDQVELGVADLFLHVGRLAVDRRAEAGFAELALDLLTVRQHVVVEAEDADLFRCQPEREGGGEVFNQHADEALHRPERSPVNHDWSVRRVVVADVLQVEAFGQVVVELHGPQLPLATDRVADHEVRLRSVERGLSFTLGEFEAGLLKDFAEDTLGLIPQFVGADILVGAGLTHAELDAIVLEADGGKDELHQVERVLEFLFNLIGRAEEVGVVLGEAADSQHAVEFARLLVPIDGAELGQPDREVTVRSGDRLVHLHVMRAVHRLEQIPLLLMLPGTCRYAILIRLLGRIGRTCNP